MCILDEQELTEVVREFSAGSGNDTNKGSRGENKVLYDDFVDMLVVGSPRCVRQATTTERGVLAAGRRWFFIYYYIIICRVLIVCMYRIRRISNSKERVLIFCMI